ncbi:MAG: FHA domain-containing protein, partial [Myxococcales bacterium]|nr:FHA domain-containing protein [Myxococcales bacterium]
MAKLIYVDNQGQEATVFINPQNPVATIGRNPDRTIVTRDNTVSRAHAQVQLVDNVFSFVDNGSSNGTYVNDVRVKEQMINDGDVLRCGSFILRFVLEEYERAGAAAPQAGVAPAADATAAFTFDIKDQQALLEKLVEFKTAKEQAEHQYRNQVALTQEFQRKFSLTENALTEAKQEMAGIAVQVHELQQQLDIKNQEIMQLRAASANFGGGDDSGATAVMDAGAAAFVEKFNQQIDTLRKENQELQEKVRQGGGAGDAENLRKVVESLKSENQTLRVDLQMAKAQAHSAPPAPAVDTTALESQIAALTARNEELEQSVAAHDGARADELMAELEQLRGRVGELESSLDDERATHGADSEQLANEIEALRTENEQYEARLGEVEQLQRENAALHEQVSELESLRGTVETLEGQLAELADAPPPVDAEMQAELERAREELLAAQGETSELRARVDELEAQAQEAARVAELEEEVRLADEKIRELKDELRDRPAAHDIESLNRERRDLRDEIERLTNALEMAPSVQDFDDLRYERDQLRDELEKRPSDAQMQQIADEKLAMQEEIENLKLVLAQAPGEEELDAFRSEIEGLTEQLEQAKTTIANSPSREQYDELQQEIEHLVADRTRFKEEKKILEDRLVQLDEVKEIQVREQFNDRLDEKDQQIQKLRDQALALKNDRDEANKIILSANLDEVQELRSFKQQALNPDGGLQARLDAATQEAATARAELESMRQQVFEQTGEYDELVRRSADLEREVQEYKEMMVYAPTAEQMEALKDDINQVARERDHLRKQLESIEDRHLLAFQQQEKQIARLTEERDQSLGEMRGLKKRITELEGTGGADPELVKKLREENDAQSRQIQSLRDKMANIEQQRDELNGTLRELRNDSSDLRAEYGQVQSEWAKLKRLFGEKANAADVEKVVDERDDLKKRLEKLQREKGMLEEMVVSGGAKDDEVSQRFQELQRENEKLRQRVSSAGDGDEALRKRVGQLEEENELLKSSVKSFERKLLRAQESEGDGNEVQQLRERVTALEGERDRLKKEVASSSGADAEAETRRLSQEVSKLKEQLASAGSSGARAGGSSQGGIAGDQLEELVDMFSEVNDIASNWRMNIKLIHEYFNEIKLGMMNLKSEGSSALTETLRDFE